MATISYDPRLNPRVGKTNNHGVITEEIEGLIRVYRDGQVERFPIVPSVPCGVLADELGVTSRDVVFNKLWARVYVPNCYGRHLPLLVYFHGGGFCVGSASWSCYHQFLAKLASIAGCIIFSVNYRLAPENRLPSAYEDGFDAVMWLKLQALNGSSENNWWLSRCNFSSLFLGGDSAGANIAYNAASRLVPESIIRPLCLKGMILIQPFHGGEARTFSEKNMDQPPNSALNLSTSDTYWRLSLPVGANRDHPYCNPLFNGSYKLRDLRLPPMMVCISEMDILKDRNMEFCSALTQTGKKVETVVYKGVGHAFQVLHNSPHSHLRIQELMSHLKAFINQ